MSKISAINARLADRMGELARDLMGSEASHATRTALRFRGRGSLAVVIAGAKQGAWHDHEAGCGGDPLGLIAHIRRTSMAEAMAWARAWLGEEPDVARQPRPTDVTARQAADAADDRGNAWSLNLARTLWRDAVRPAGTLVELYLQSRGLTLPDDAPLRFHPSAWRNRAGGSQGPAMVALMTSPAGNQPVGVHVTYLRPDGTAKADGDRVKIMLGAQGVVRLVPDEDVTEGLGLAEGIETALATMQRAGWRPVWAATSAGAIARFPVLDGIEALTVFADRDTAGLEAARACCTRWAGAGREARILTPPVGDWDDALRCTA